MKKSIDAAIEIDRGTPIPSEKPNMMSIKKSKATRLFNGVENELKFVDVMCLVCTQSLFETPKCGNVLKKQQHQRSFEC